MKEMYEEKRVRKKPKETRGIIVEALDTRINSHKSHSSPYHTFNALFPHPIIFSTRSLRNYAVEVGSRPERVVGLPRVAIPVGVYTS